MGGVIVHQAAIKLQAVSALNCTPCSFITRQLLPSPQIIPHADACTASWWPPLVILPSYQSSYSSPRLLHLVFLSHSVQCPLQTCSRLTVLDVVDTKGFALGSHLMYLKIYKECRQLCSLSYDERHKKHVEELCRNCGSSRILAGDDVISKDSRFYVTLQQAVSCSHDLVSSCTHYYYYHHHHHHLLYAGYLYLYSWDKLCP